MSPRADDPQPLSVSQTFFHALHRISAPLSAYGKQTGTIGMPKKRTHGPLRQHKGALSRCVCCVREAPGGSIGQALLLECAWPGAILCCVLPESVLFPVRSSPLRHLYLTLFSDLDLPAFFINIQRTREKRREEREREERSGRVHDR